VVRCFFGGLTVRLLQYPARSGDEEDATELADAPVQASALSWGSNRAFPERAAKLRVGLGGPPAAYELVVEPSEVGVILGSVRQEDVGRVMVAFLEAADPEVIGAVVGHVITHLALCRTAAPAREGG
jgi:hypothetical protein